MTTTADLWRFAWAQGLPIREVIALLIGLVLLAATLYATAYAWREPFAQWTYANVASPLIGLGITGACFLVVWAGVRERYLLRPGAGRYTTASIVQHRHWKGKPRYLGVYYVQGHRYQKEGDCGIENGQELPCPALGSRQYVYFAPEDPTTAQLTARPVPDTVQQVPAQGWKCIP